MIASPALAKEGTIRSAGATTIMSDSSVGVRRRHSKGGALPQAAFALRRLHPAEGRGVRRATSPRRRPASRRAAPFQPRRPTANPTDGWDPLDAERSRRPASAIRSTAARAARLCRRPGRRARQGATAGRARPGAARPAARGARRRAASIASGSPGKLRQTVLLSSPRSSARSASHRPARRAHRERRRACSPTPPNRRCCASTRRCAAGRGQGPKTVFAVGDALARGPFVLESASTSSRTAPNCGSNSSPRQSTACRALPDGC